MNESKITRVLHVVGGMNRGGVETWLMHVLRTIDRDRFILDFLVQTDSPGVFDDEIRRLGSRILPCPHTRNPVQYAITFRQLLREHGPYDVIHSHVHHFSGFVLALARTERVPVRIAHSHSDTSQLQADSAWIRKIYYRGFKTLIRKFSTLGLAGNTEAAEALYGPRWSSSDDYRVLHYGIDLAPFRADVDTKRIREDLGLPPDSFVVGQVGRFTPVKNHEFTLRIAAETKEKLPNVHFLFVGDGPLRQAIELKTERMGLRHHVTFAGPRDDVPQIMMGAMDAFVMPSLYEGLPIAGIEAQAAGVPCLLSDVITDQVAIVEGQVAFLPTLQARSWVEAIHNLQDDGDPPNRSVSLELLANSQFNIQKSVKRLEQLYEAPF